jgi:1-acyl-sn-glycerol-3-phosphate acyltransferase
MLHFLGLLRAWLIIDPLIVLSTALFGTWSIILSFFDRDGRRQHRTARAWGRSLLLIAGVRVQVEGGENLAPGQNYVLAANHLSYMDIPALLPHIPAEFRFMAKRSLWKTPFLGHHLEKAGHLPVDFENPRNSLKSMKEAAQTVAQRRISVLVFPEGGRSPGALRPFREGVAYIAIRARVPVVPIGIVGTREVVPMGSFHVRPGKVCIQIGPPIPTVGLAMHDRAAFTEQLFERVSSLMEQAWRQRAEM